MILVADSGSTKCDWVLIDKDQRLTAHTMGFNPFFHSEELIDLKIKENQVLNQYADQVTEIYYYGAGCSNPERNLVLEKALSRRFPNQRRLVVKEDLHGAAYATCGNESGVVCILGTGSNACYYTGENVRKGLPALGYVLGDEGSGSYFGKILISNYLYKKLPEELAVALQDFNNQRAETLVSTVYNKPDANVFLATYMKFIVNHSEHPYIQKMLCDGMRHFAEIHILHHPEYKTTPVNFVGSVAYFFNDVLVDVGRELGFSVGKVIRKPIDALASYHSKLLELELKDDLKTQ